MRVQTVAWQALCLMLVVLMFPSVGVAEGISGLVKDAQGGVLPGATVTIENVDTSVTRTVVTGPAGRYDATGLPPSTYVVGASLPGFMTVIRRGVTLTVGRDIVVDMVLAVGEITDEIVVVGEAPLVDTTSAAVSGLVDERAIRDLPLVSRSWDQLITLQSGAVVYRPRVAGGSQGFAQTFTISGQRFTSNAFYQDGVELGGAQRLTGLPGSAAGVNLGVEGIREFRVLTSSYSPEYGKKAGGAIITVTKSGTNKLRGSVFEFHRNDALDAPNFFAVTEKDPFMRNNYGAAVGGPIVRNRSFFFANYEALRERLALPFSAIVPNEAVRQGFLPGPGGALQLVGVAPVVQPFLNLWPMPNGRDFGDGTAAYDHAPTRTAKEDYVLLRFDHTFSGKDSLFASYTFSDAEVESPLENPFFAELLGTREQRFAIEHKRIVSSQMLNALRFGFHRSFHDTGNQELTDLSRLGLPQVNPGYGHVNLRVTGLAFGGPGTYGWTFGERNSFQLYDQVSYVRDRHTLELGGHLQRIQFNEDPEERKNGEWLFDGLRQLLLAQPRTFTGVFPPGSTGVLSIGLPMDIQNVKAWRHTYGALYARDRFSVTPNLTLDLGLRYEVLSSPTEANGRASNMPLKEVTPINRVMDTTPIIGKKIWPTNYLAGFAPRIGVAWNPFGDGKTSVRGGYGIFYDQPESEFRFWMHINPPFAPRPTTSRSDAFPVPWDKVAVSNLRLAGRSIDPNLDVPTVMHYNLGVDQQVGSAGMFRVTYVGATGYNLLVDVETNLAVAQLVDGELFWPAGAPRAQPALANWDLLMSNGSSRYDALQAEFQTRFSASGPLRRLRSKVAYTFSKAIDDVSTLQGTAGQHTSSKPMDPFDIERDRGLAGHHTAQLFSLNFTLDLQGLPLHGLAGALFSNWQGSGIWTVASGVPINIQNGGIRSSRNQQNSSSERPDLIAGGNNNPVLGGYERYFDPSQFVVPPAGFLGNLGRNTLLGPPVATFDMALARHFPVGLVSERFNLQVRLEVFNLFNRVNLGVPDRLLFDSAGRTRGAAGRISNTSTPGRQMQLGVKLEF